MRRKKRKVVAVEMIKKTNIRGKNRTISSVNCAPVTDNQVLMISNGPLVGKKKVEICQLTRIIIPIKTRVSGFVGCRVVFTSNLDTGLCSKWST